MKAFTSHKMMMAKHRQEQIDAGVYGRFKERSVPSKKQYSRKGRDAKKYLEGA